MARCRMVSAMDDLANSPDLFFDVKADLLPFLVDRGFAISLELYEPDVFGNCVIKLQSNDFLIVVTRDRTQVLMDIGLPSKPDSLFALGVLIAFTEGSQDVQPLLTLEDEIPLLLRYADRLLNKSLLTDRAGEIVKFRREWSDRRWERLRKDTGEQP